MDGSAGFVSERTSSTSKVHRWGRSSRYTSEPSVPHRPPLPSGFCLRVGSRKGNRGGRGATTDGGRRDDARRVQIPPRGRAAPGFLWANLENYRPGWPRANATTDAKGRFRLPVVPAIHNFAYPAPTFLFCFFFSTDFFADNSRVSMTQVQRQRSESFSLVVAVWCAFSYHFLGFN